MRNKSFANVYDKWFQKENRFKIRVYIKQNIQEPAYQVNKWNNIGRTCTHNTAYSKDSYARLQKLVLYRVYSNIESVPQWPEIRARPVCVSTTKRTHDLATACVDFWVAQKKRNRNGASFCYILIRIQWCVWKFAHACWYRYSKWGVVFAYDNIIVRNTIAILRDPNLNNFQAFARLWT